LTTTVCRQLLLTIAPQHPFLKSVNIKQQRKAIVELLQKMKKDKPAAGMSLG
jgi:hypothetical protein